MPGRRGDVLGGAPHRAPRSTTRSSACCSERGLIDRRSATRAASRPTSAPRRGARAASSRPPSARATPATGSRSRSTPPRASSIATAPTGSSGEGGTLDTNEMIDLWADLCDRYPDRVDRGRPGRERLGRLADAHRPARRTAAARRRRPLRHERRASCARGIAERVGNAILVKVNQIGTLTETLEAVELAHRRRLPRGRLAPLGRDRGRDDRRPRRRDQRRPDQDRRPGPLRPRREVQPAPADRGGARRPRPSTPAGPRSPVGRLTVGV